jgi:hypothetical protein
MTPFRIFPLDPGELDRIRAAGVDDFGNPFIVRVSEGGNGGEPLRCCLREATPGERIALIAWRPAPVGGPYAEVGPVFVHADRCEGYMRADAYPEGFRHRRLLLRAYDVAGCQVDNVIEEGHEMETAISRLFGRREVAYLHTRNVLAGCYMFTVGRAGSPASRAAVAD